MITDSDRQILSKEIPFRFTKKIQDILIEKKQHVYSNKHIAKVFNGKNKNLTIEVAIWELYKKIIIEKKKLNKLKTSTKKNSKADTLESN
jgi:uncharacterized protein YifE (UPF0438 family)